APADRRGPAWRYGARNQAGTVSRKLIEHSDLRPTTLRCSRRPAISLPVFALVERGGEVRSFHVANVNSKTLRPILVKNASRKSYLMTDEAGVYVKTGREFAGHVTVNHSADEYVRGDFWYTNTVESYFALLKRGMMGSFDNVSEAHLYRYLAEFDFKHNHRKISDGEQAEELLRGAKGKRLTYQQPREAANA
ncbi:MAG: IS1595 family transposase, partial [Alphaproteobacteria bacterium]|nr:IS1595 family transposase [Alphaproteobacteria bacterium]